MPVGDNYLTSLSISGMISRTFDIYCSNISVFIGLTALYVGMNFASSFFLSSVFDQGSYRPSAISMGLNAVFTISLTFAYKIAMIKVISHAYAGLNTTWKTALMSVMENYVTVFLSGGLYYFSAFTPFMIFGLIADKSDYPSLMFWTLFSLIPVCYIFVVFSLHDLAIVVESKGVLESLSRSYNLISGFFIETFCVVASFFLVQLLTYFIFSAFPPILIILPMLVFAPTTVIIIAVIYFNLRLQKEGLSKVNLLSDLRLNEETEEDNVGQYEAIAMTDKV